MDQPGKNDNRSYHYEANRVSQRDEYAPVSELIDVNAKVLDLGCGDGSLLHFLREKKSAKGVGVELVATGVEATRKKDFICFEQAIDQGLSQFGDQSFDVAISNVTIQMVMYPEKLLMEMGRIARHQIISFPNFAFYKNRLDLLLRGRMPRFGLFGYSWYSTGHIHQLSLKDFEEFVLSHGFKIEKTVPVNLPKAWWKRFLAKRFPNLFVVTCIYLLRKA